MNRRAFPVCAGGLTLLAAIAGAYLADDLSWPAAAQAPGLLPSAPHAMQAADGLPDEPPVQATGLIQPAVPPGTKSTKKQPDAQPAPIAAAEAPSEPTLLIAAKPAPAPAVASKDNETRFLQDSVAGSLSPMLAPKTTTNLVTRHKTQLATPLITPALAPATAAKPAAVVQQPAVQQPKVAAKPVAPPAPKVAEPIENKLRMAPEVVAPAVEPPAVAATPEPQPEQVAVDTAPPQEAAPPQEPAPPKPEPAKPVVAPSLQPAPLAVAKSVPAAKVQPAQPADKAQPDDKGQPAEKPVAPEEEAPKLAAEPAPLKVEVAQPETITEPAPAAPAEEIAEAAPQPAAKATEPPAVMPLAEAPTEEVAAPSQTNLPWSTMPKRSPETVAAVKNATQRVHHGFELAERGALYAAQAEFTAGLKLIAQAYDLQEGTRRHTKAASAGLTALKEARDFVQQSESLREIDIASVILPHVTPVLKDSDTADITPIDAAQCYYSYAQEQLSAATGQEMTGSMALYAMGKVSALVSKSSGQHLEQRSQAIALYRAALIAEPRNFRAANELGVMLAENGQLELARDLLIRSVAVSPQVTTWKNLAAVHTRVGDRNLAEQAREQARVMQQGKEPSTAPAVQWVDAATFSGTASAGDNMPPAIAAGKKPTPAAAEQAPKSSVNVAKSLSDLLRISPRR